MSENTGPVEVDQPVTQMGGTFAERKAAREAAEKRSSKAVDAAEGTVEDKAVAKKRTTRKAAKKS